MRKHLRLVALLVPMVLVASIGFENFLNIWKFTKAEGGFNLGFRKAAGIEISDFYSKFESARASMKIGTR